MYQENDLNTIKFFKKTNSARSDTSYTSTAFDLKLFGEIHQIQQK